MEQSKETPTVTNEDNIKVLNKPDEENTHQGTVQENTAPQSQEDLISRVTRFVQEENPENKSDDQIDEDVFNDKELRDKIAQYEESDPDLAKQLKLLRKSAMSGLNDKFQQLSEKLKEIESSQKSGVANEQWTPERVQKLVNDPEFVKAAQAVASEDVDEDDEYVPESVKKKLKELDSIKEHMNRQQQEQFKAQIQQEHTQLAQRYGNYDPNKIDEIRSDLLQGKINPNSETIYKAFYHDENVKRAYEAGRKDEREGLAEKKESSTFSQGAQVPNADIKPDENESDQAFLKRIIGKVTSQNKK